MGSEMPPAWGPAASPRGRSSGAGCSRQLRGWDLEVRHILVPRVDVAFLSLRSSSEENLEIVRDSGHSCLPLCENGLDTVIGMVHAQEVLAAVALGQDPDLRKLSRRPQFVSDTQPLSRLILQLQRAASHCCLGRPARQGDTLEIEGFRATVLQVARRRIVRIRLEPLDV